MKSRSKRILEHFKMSLTTLEKLAIEKTLYTMYPGTDSDVIDWITLFMDCLNNIEGKKDYINSGTIIARLNLIKTKNINAYNEICTIYKDYIEGICKYIPSVKVPEAILEPEVFIPETTPTTLESKDLVPEFMCDICNTCEYGTLCTFAPTVYSESSNMRNMNLHACKGCLETLIETLGFYNIIQGDMYNISPFEIIKHVKKSISLSGDEIQILVSRALIFIEMLWKERGINQKPNMSDLTSIYITLSTWDCFQEQIMYFSESLN